MIQKKVEIFLSKKVYSVNTIRLVEDGGIMGYYDNVLEHHGILGQKWGVRRFENEDGSLTSAGKARYHTDSEGNYQKLKTAKSNYKAASKEFYKSTSKKVSGNYYFRKSNYQI